MNRVHMVGIHSTCLCTAAFRVQARQEMPRRITLAWDVDISYCL
jgi:hypothetical protein